MAYSRQTPSESSEPEPLPEICNCQGHIGPGIPFRISTSLARGLAHPAVESLVFFHDPLLALFLSLEKLVASGQEGKPTIELDRRLPLYHCCGKKSTFHVLLAFRVLGHALLQVHQLGPYRWQPPALPLRPRIFPTISSFVPSTISTISLQNIKRSTVCPLFDGR